MMESCKIIHDITRSCTKGHGFTCQKDCLRLGWKLLNSIFERLEAVKLRTVSRMVSSRLLSTQFLVAIYQALRITFVQRTFVAHSSLNWRAHKVRT